MIRRADLDHIVRDAVVLDLDDLARRGQQLCAQAEAEAARIISDAQQTRAKLLETAEAEGHAKGLEQGLAQGLKQGLEQGHAEAFEQSADEIKELTAAWHGAFDQFESIRESMLDEARSDVLALAVRLAEKILKRTAPEGGHHITADEVREVVDLDVGLIAGGTEMTFKYIFESFPPVVAAEPFHQT